MTTEDSETPLTLAEELNDILEDMTIDLIILNNNKIKLTSQYEFESLLKSKTNKDLNWFFTDYLTPLDSTI